MRKNKYINNSNSNSNTKIYFGKLYVKKIQFKNQSMKIFKIFIDSQKLVTYNKRLQLYL